MNYKRRAMLLNGDLVQIVGVSGYAFVPFASKLVYGWPLGEAEGVSVVYEEETGIKRYHIVLDRWLWKRACPCCGRDY